MAVEVIDGERVGGIIDIADRQPHDLGLECPDLLTQIPQGVTPETQVGDGDFMSGLLRGGGDITQPQGKDRVRQVFPVGGDEQDPHDYSVPGVITRRVPSMPRSRWLFMNSSFLLQKKV